MFRWVLFRAGRLGDRSLAVVAFGSVTKIGSHRSGRFADPKRQYAATANSVHCGSLEGFKIAGSLPCAIENINNNSANSDNKI